MDKKLVVAATFIVTVIVSSFLAFGFRSELSSSVVRSSPDSVQITGDNNGGEVRLECGCSCFAQHPRRLLCEEPINPFVPERDSCSSSVYILTAPPGATSCAEAFEGKPCVGYDLDTGEPTNGTYDLCFQKDWFDLWMDASDNMN